MSPAADVDVRPVRVALESLRRTVSGVVVGQDEAIRLAFFTLLCSCRVTDKFRSS